ALQQFLLRGRQVEPRAVTSLEPLDPHIHFLSLESRGEPEEHHDCVGLARDALRLSQQIVLRGRPDELDLSISVGFLGLEPEPIFLPRLELHLLSGPEPGIPELIAIVVDGLYHETVLEVELEAASGDGADAVRPGALRSQYAGPADTEV